jgi:hypothetical protein
MVSNSTPAQRPTESPAVHLREQQQQQLCPGQSPKAVIIRVQHNQEHENWLTYSNTAY